jgi:flagellin
MSIVINTNSAASAAAANLNASNAMLQKSLSRLSSGFKIASPADDAGGLAVSMKLNAAISRNDAVNTNVSNAISFLQTQDGAMKTAAKILDRMSELRTLYDDVTKTTSDKDNYDSEFTELKAQMADVVAEKFNGISLFGNSAATLTVNTTEDSSQNVAINQSDLNTATTTLASASSLSSIGVSTVSAAITSVADLRATNGAQTSRLQFASEMLTVNRTNLEAANSRIVDTDIARESTAYARNNILVQSGTAMLAQANQTSQVALRLLG